ncbi:hypothetical protein BPAE_0025g00160 [Botrytis paeoniae]|uniref:Uncharacterized protein n=1 Tax=Botrytis paeoniae TaxID=278948 RepID=A0A4Z1G3F8_9HELO|nr:hypothetical protein BPAE_0025g00160 [Botrytis paeoniae]
MPQVSDEVYETRGNCLIRCAEFEECMGITKIMSKSVAEEAAWRAKGRHSTNGARTRGYESHSAVVC